MAEEGKSRHTVLLCRGQEFAEPAERFMKQHTRSDKHKAAATEAWGSPASLEDVKALFGKFLSNESCPFPWAEASLPAGCSAVVPQLQKMVASGYLPINALSQVCDSPAVAGTDACAFFSEFF